MLVTSQIFNQWRKKVNEFRMISFLEIILNHFFFRIGLFWESHVSYPTPPPPPTFFFFFFKKKKKNIKILKTKVF